MNHKLLIPGWAGVLLPEEAKYIAGELSKSPALRRRWGLGKGQGQRITLLNIAERAYPEDTVEAKRYMVSGIRSRARARRRDATKT